MSAVTKSNLYNLSPGDEPSTISQKVLHDFVLSAKQNDISALLQTIIDDQYSLKKEIVDELENSRCQIRGLVLPVLNEISDRVNTKSTVCCELTRSFAKYGSRLTESIPNDFSTSQGGEDSKPDLSARTAALAKKLLHDQHEFRCKIFSLLRNQTEEISNEMLSLIDVSKMEIYQKLESIETEAKMLLPLYENTLNRVGCIFSQIEATFDSMNAKVDILERKLQNFENFTIVRTASNMPKFFPPKSNSRMSNSNDDTCSVLSYKTDSSSVLHSLKAMVTKQNQIMSAQRRRSNDSSSQHVDIVESPMKIDDDVKANWLQAPVLFRYDENVFWNRFNAYKIIYVPIETLTMYLKTLVVLSVTNESKQKFFDLALYCAIQLRNPNITDELLLVNDEPFLYKNGQPAKLPEPTIDWMSMLDSADDIFVSLTEEEQEFIEKVMQMDNETLIVWGCAYACILTRLSEKGTISIVDKLKYLNEELAQIYDVNKDQLPVIPVGESFINKLRAYTEFELDEYARNTFYKGMIERYESFTDAENIKRLLNYLVLVSLRYKEMSLLTLIDEVLKTYQVQLEELIACTTYSKTVDSWKNFFSFIFSEIYVHCKKWKYCAVFEPSSYSIFSFDANYCLCSLLCFLIDFKNFKNDKSNKILYHQLIKKTKPEWFTDEFISNYVKTSLKHLRKYSKVL